MADDRIRIFDTTLRDGEQSPGCSMNLAEKLALARQLEKLDILRRVRIAGLDDTAEQSPLLRFDKSG